MSDLERPTTDIAKVLVRYATGIDRRDWELFRTLLHRGRDLDYGESVPGAASTLSPSSCSRRTRWQATPCIG